MSSEEYKNKFQWAIYDALKTNEKVKQSPSMLRVNNALQYVTAVEIKCRNCKALLEWTVPSRAPLYEAELECPTCKHKQGVSTMVLSAT